MRLITGRLKHQKKNKTINHKAEKHMWECQRTLDKDKKEYDKKDHWKRIPQELDSDLKLLCYDCHEKVHLEKDKKTAQKRKTIAKAIKNKPQEHKYHCGKYYNPVEARKTSPVIIVSQSKVI